MKDLSHHLKKLNRRIIRSFHREELEEAGFEENLPSLPVQKETPREMKKIKTRAVLKERMERTPIHLTQEERNREMKKRVPIFDRTNNAQPRHTKASRKKTPRI